MKQNEKNKLILRIKILKLAYQKNKLKISDSNYFKLHSCHWILRKGFSIPDSRIDFINKLYDDYKNDR